MHVLSLDDFSSSTWDRSFMLRFRYVINAKTTSVVKPPVAAFCVIIPVRIADRA